jgi:adenylate kinase family enzyme
MKIALMGCSGSGKSTFARQLELELGYPAIELDSFYHLHNWKPASDQDFQERVLSALASSQKESGGWIADGNYLSKLGDTVIARADVVIWFNLPRAVVMRRIIKRSLQRVLTRKVLWNGNRESLTNLLRWNPDFNVVRWAWTQHGAYIKKLSALAEAAEDSGEPQWIEIKSDAEVKKTMNYLSSINI